MPTALITGITGQDGSYLAESLLADGWSVHGLVQPGDPHLAALRARAATAHTHDADLADDAGLSALVAEVGPDVVYNLGGISSVATSWREPVLTTRISGLAVGVLLEAAWQLQERSGHAVRFVQASSAEIFGAPQVSPQTEDTPIRPITPYGAAKALAHHLVGVYRARGLPASACILYNHESPRRPDSFVTRKITMAAAAIATGRADELALGNLDARRDWGWAPDYVRALRAAAEQDHPDDYVIATGVARSVRDFVAAAFTRAGVNDWERHVRVDAELIRPADAAEQVGDATRAHRVLGWAPSIGFEEMVGRMVEADRRRLADPPDAPSEPA